MLMVAGSGGLAQEQLQIRYREHGLITQQPQATKRICFKTSFIAKSMGTGHFLTTAYLHMFGAEVR